MALGEIVQNRTVNTLLYPNCSLTNETIPGPNCTVINSTGGHCNGTVPDVVPPCSTGVLETFEEKIGLVVANSVVLLVALIGNMLITMVVLGNKNMKRSTNYFILNMAVSDLVVPILVIPREITEVFLGHSRWLLLGDVGMVLCKITAFLQDVTTAVSIFSIMLITIDRFFAVVFPLKHYLMSSRICKILISLTWLLAMGIHAVILYVVRTVQVKNNVYCYAFWKTAFDDPMVQKAYFLSAFFALAVWPFVVMTIAYSIIIIKLKRHSLPLGDSVTDRQRRQRAEREQKVVRMAIAIVVSFACCWAPFNVGAFLSFFILPVRTPCWFHPYMFYAYFLANASAALNPCICFIFSENFRQGLKSCFRRRFKRLLCLEDNECNITSTTATPKTEISMTVYSKENRAYDGAQ